MYVKWQKARTLLRLGPFPRSRMKCIAVYFSLKHLIFWSFNKDRECYAVLANITTLFFLITTLAFCRLTYTCCQTPLYCFHVMPWRPCWHALKRRIYQITNNVARPVFRPLIEMKFAIFQKTLICITMVLKAMQKNGSGN